MKINSEDSLSPEVFGKLKEIFEEPYLLSRNTAIYSEVVTGELIYRGMGELRDVLEHIRRVLNSNDDDEAMNNIIEAYEHLRRGAVESIQQAANKIYLDTINVIKTPPFFAKLLFLEVPDKSKVRKLRMETMKQIAEGRLQKSDKDKWMDSINNFKTAIELCFELQDIYPTKNEIKYRIFNISCGIVTIISLLIAIYALFFYK
jgi:hypothetical protein